MKNLKTPLTSQAIQNLRVGDKILINGFIITGRDATLPQLVDLIEKGKNPLSLVGAVIMHTAVSPAGIGPTTSNKKEIEDSIPPLARSGVKIHIGKGSLSKETIKALKKYGSVFAVTPPASALLTSKVISKEVVLFPEEGMEAVHNLQVKDFPAIVAVANGRSIYHKNQRID